MFQSFLSRIALAVFACVAAQGATIDFGFLTLNNVGTGSLVDPGDDYLEFHLNNWTGFPGMTVDRPVTFKNVQLDVDWIGTPGFAGPIQWFVDGDDHHLSPVTSNHLAPSIVSYESTRFQRRYGIAKATLTMILEPVAGMNLALPSSGVYELTLWPSANGRFTADVDAWDFVVPVSVPLGVPEPSTFTTGFIGFVAVYLTRRLANAKAGR